MKLFFTTALIAFASLCYFPYSIAQDTSKPATVWHVHQDTTHHFKVEFPGVPAKDNNGAVILSYADESNQIAYIATAMYIGKLKDLSDKQYLDTVTSQYAKNRNGTILSKKEISYNGFTGIEFMLSVESNVSQSRMFVINDKFYTLSVEYAEDNFRNNYSTYFFNSFKPLPGGASKPAAWFDFKSREGSFSVRLPDQPQVMDRAIKVTESPDSLPGHLKIYMAVDHDQSINYLVRYYDYPRGMYLVNKSTVADGQIKEIVARGEMVVKPSVIYKDGVEGLAFDVRIQGNYMEVQFFMRGNRNYVLIRHNNGSDKPTVKDGFFDSFKFTPPSDISWVPVSLKGANFVFPEKPVLLSRQEADHESFLRDVENHYAINPASGGVYGVEQAMITPYFRSKDLDTLYQAFFNNIKGEHAKDVRTEAVRIGPVLARDFYFSDTLSGMDNRYRLWIYKDKFYYQSLLADKAELEMPQAADFFNKMTPVTDNSTFDVAASKAALIVRDLRSTDTLVSKYALGAFNYYDFEKQELPHLYEGLKHRYADDKSPVGARSKIIRKLKLVNDDQTVEVLKRVFADAQNTDELRAMALVGVTDVDKGMYDWYFNALKESRFKELSDSWNMFSPLRDSLQFVAGRFKDVVSMMSVDSYRPSLFNLYTLMLYHDDKEAFKPILDAHKTELSAYMIKDLETFLQQNGDDKDYALMYRYLDVLPEIGLKEEADVLTTRLIKVDSVPNLITASIAVRIKMGLEVDAKLLQKELDSLSSRYTVMEAFFDSGKINKVPAQYKVDAEYAKLLFYNYLGEEYGYPASIVGLGSMDENGKRYYVVECTYIGDDDVKETYIGVCGPFDVKSSAFKLKGYWTLSDFKEKQADWKSQAKKLIPGLETEGMEY